MALAIPFLVGVLMALSVKPTPPLVTQNDRTAALGENWSSSSQIASSSKSGSMTDGGNTESSGTIASVPAPTPAPTPPEVDPSFAALPSAPVDDPSDVDLPDPKVDELTDAETLAALFGDPPEPEPSPSPEPPVSPEPNDLAGFDLPPQPDGGDPTNPGAGEVAGMIATGPETEPGPDEVPAPTPPEQEPVEDLRELMNRTRKEVTAELDERFPMHKKEELVTITMSTGASVKGTIVYMQPDSLVLSVRGERPNKIAYRSLSAGSRIRCDQDFRQAKIATETEKRVIDALE